MKAGYVARATVGTLLLAAFVQTACTPAGTLTPDVDGLHHERDGGSDDSGEKPDAGPDENPEPDAGVRAGWECLDDPERIPEGEGSNDASAIDCTWPNPGVVGTPWCDWLCLTAQHDLGHAEKVQIRAQRDRRHPKPGDCGDVGPISSFLWRAPYAGRWVFDTSGSENTHFEEAIDPRCSARPELELDCGGGPGRTFVRDMVAGEPIFLIAGVTPSEQSGPANILINITPLTSSEEGRDCLDGADNDADGLADCDDPDCASGPWCTSPACAHEILPGTIPFETEGDLSIECHLNRFSGCAGERTRERVFAWQAPLTGRVVFDADDSEFSSMLSVRKGSCVGPELAPRGVSWCPRRDYWDPTATAAGVDVVEGEWYYVMLSATSRHNAFPHDADGKPLIGYRLKIRLAEEERGERCWDGIDNDGNGWADFADEQCWEE